MLLVKNNNMIEEEENMAIEEEEIKVNEVKVPPHPAVTSDNGNMRSKG